VLKHHYVSRQRLKPFVNSEEINYHNDVLCLKSKCFSILFRSLRSRFILSLISIETWISTWDVKLYTCITTWLSGKTLDCRPRGCEFDPLTPAQITLRRHALVLPGEMLPCIALKNMVCRVWWSLQYLALWTTYRVLTTCKPRRRMGMSECVIK